jgi:transcriptional regulator with XRE-family HTH domain
MGQQELADLCELSLDQVSNIERGKSFAGEMTLTLLAKAFRISHSALFDYSQNQDFINSGGMKWRAARKAIIPPVRNRKSLATIRSSR